MSDKFFIDSNDGVVDTLVVDESENKVHYVTEQDVEPILDHNHKIRSEGFVKSNDIWPVASIPMWKFFELKKLGIADDPAAFTKWLNDRENMKFRTSEVMV